LPRLDDYLLRLRRASVSELANRLRRTLLAFRWRRRLARGLPPPRPPRVDAAAIEPLRLPKIRPTLCAADIGALLGGRVATLNTDPIAIRAFEAVQRGRFFSRVQFDNDGPDIRAVWEPARLQHLVRSFLLDEPSENHAAQVEVLQWIKDNPFLLGPHYLSPMECGLRVPVFFYCLKSMADGSQKDADVVATAIYRHGWWIYRNLSLYNSLGNHTICECIGLIFAGAVFGHTREGAKWLARGCCLLNQEIEHQILADGGPVEQSTAYHRFVLDLYWLAYSFLNENELYDCHSWEKRLMAGESFLTAFEIGRNRTIPIGDSDDGHAVAPGIHPRRQVPQQPTNRIQYYDDAGYTVIRDGDLHLTFDHGPLGMAPLYNHGHADALSVTLTYRDQPVFIDPGTYRYNGEPEWRRYFKSTRAHNTVTVDGLDQAHQASGFIWSKPYNCKVLDRRESEDGFSIQSCHDGYCRLQDPVRHHRRISFQAPNALHIHDRFTGKGLHTFELNFHLGETAAIDRVNRWWRLDFGSFFVFLTVVEQSDATLACGQTDPPLGWNAPGYGKKHPCDVICCRRSGRPRDTTFTTAVILQDK
jgi:hypothetical protein